MTTHYRLGMGNKQKDERPQTPAVSSSLYSQIEMIRQAPIPYLLALCAAIGFVTL
jgi:hypothetical protein